MSKPTPLKVSAPVRSCSNSYTEESREEKKRTDIGEGLFSPHPSLSVSVQSQVWHHLTAGLRALSDNDHGRPWPNPDRAALRRLIAEHDADLCIRAAREAREIVQSQDRAPNITALFAKKLAELADVRSTVRESLEGVQCP